MNAEPALKYLSRSDHPYGRRQHVPSGSRRQALVLIGRPGIERSLLEALREQPFDVHRVETAARASTMIQTCEPEIIFTDLMAPDQSAADLCRQLRSISDSVIFVVAADDDRDSCIDALRAGADAFVTHPIRHLELLARVDALLRRLKPRYEEAVEAGDIRVDLQTREVTVAGRRTRLRPKEFDLLTHLVRQPETVHTHRMLLAAIWGAAVQRRPHYVRMCVAHLRRMIEPDPKSPRYLVTERAVGYRLQPFAGRRVA